MISLPNFQALVYASPTAAAPIGQTVLFSPLYAMPQCSAVLSTSPTTGDVEEMCPAAAESAGLVKDVKPAGDMVREIMDETKRMVEARRMPWGGGGQAEEA
jgi:hypothetical protein